MDLCKKPLANCVYCIVKFRQLFLIAKSSCLPLRTVIMMAHAEISPVVFVRST